MVTPCPAMHVIDDAGDEGLGQGGVSWWYDFLRRVGVSWCNVFGALCAASFVVSLIDDCPV